MGTHTKGGRQQRWDMRLGMEMRMIITQVSSWCTVMSRDPGEDPHTDVLSPFSQVPEVGRIEMHSRARCHSGQRVTGLLL